MRILFLSQRFLMPMDTGGRIRTGNILKHLLRDNEIILISNVEKPKDTPYLPEMKNFCSRFIQAPWKKASRNHPCSIRNACGKEMSEANQNMGISE